MKNKDCIYCGISFTLKGHSIRERVTMEDVIVQTEKQHLEQIKRKLSESLEKEKSTLENQKKDLLEQRRKMWEDGAHGVAEFDDIVNMARYDERVREAHGHYVRIDKEVRQMTYLLQTPYFGRVDFTEKGESLADEIYIGRYGFFDKKTYNCYIYDWRSPVASMFYDCALGEASYKCPEGEIEGTLTCKRQYQIEDGELKYCYDTNMAVQDELLGKVLSENTDKSRTLPFVSLTWWTFWWKALREAARPV